MRISLLAFGISIAAPFAVVACMTTDADVAGETGSASAIRDQDQARGGGHGDESNSAARPKLHRAPKWHGDKAHGSGGGCKFASDDAGPADAFVVANGDDVAVVFTRLGEATKFGARNRLIESRCAFQLPLDVDDGWYISGFSQSVEYGIVKPAGVAAGLDVRSSLVATRGGSFALPTLEATFDAGSAVDIALDVLSADTTIFEENHDHGDNARKRWCDRGRSPDVALSAVARTWVQRSPTDLDQEVIIAVDGLDMHLELGATVETCPTPDAGAPKATTSADASGSQGNGRDDHRDDGHGGGSSHH